MTVLQAVEHFQKMAHEVVPNLECPVICFTMTPGQLAAALMREISNQPKTADEFREEIGATNDPKEVTEVVADWIQHRHETLDQNRWDDEDRLQDRTQEENLEDWEAGAQTTPTFEADTRRSSTTD